MQANEDGVREGRIAPERGAKVARLLEAALGWLANVTPS